MERGLASVEIDVIEHKEVNELKAERLAKIQDPLALMANSNNLYASPAPHLDQSPFKQNFLQQPMKNLEDIINPTTAMNMALALMAKAFKLNYLTPTNNNQRISSNPRNRQIAQPVQNVRNQVAQNPRVKNDGIQKQNGNGNLVAVRAEGNEAGHNRNQIRCYNCRGHQSQPPVTIYQSPVWPSTTEEGSFRSKLEKNVGESLVRTLLNVLGKTKDGMNA
nr:hypothetical protein [Tanacetum cinerariifolium]